MKKLFRWIWNINGILFLLLLIFALINIVGEFVGKNFHRSRPEDEGIPVVSSKEKTIEKLKIEIDDDVKQIKDVLIFIVKSNMLVDKGDKSKINFVLSGSAGIGGVSDATFTVNLLFVSTATGEKRFLFDRHVLVSGVDYARIENSESQFKEPFFSPKNIFEVIDRDSNGNGRFDPNDQKDLYVSDYDGRNLKMIQADIKGYKINGYQRILISSEKNGKGTFYFYNVEKDQLRLILNVADLNIENPGAAK